MIKSSDGSDTAGTGKEEVVGLKTEKKQKALGHTWRQEASRWLSQRGNFLTSPFLLWTTGHTWVSFLYTNTVMIIILILFYNFILFYIVYYIILLLYYIQYMYIIVCIIIYNNIIHNYTYYYVVIHNISFLIIHIIM